MKRFIPSYSNLRKINLAAAFVLCLIATFFALYKLNYPLMGIDDANIYFVYARNLANGHGFVYNVGGERVEGFTSLLWTIISALAFKFTAAPPLPLLIINVTLVSVGIAYVLAYLQISSSNEKGSYSGGLFWSALFLVIIFSSPRYIVWNTFSFMENALWSTFLLLTCIFIIKDHTLTKSINAGILPLSILLILTRPESFLWVAVFVVVLFLRLAFTGGMTYALKVLAPSIIGILLTLTLITVFRIQYFGYPLPNTYYAKVSPSLAYNMKEGVAYLVRYMISDPLAMISVLAVILACYYSISKVSPAKGEFYLPLIAATGLLAPLLTGGDHFDTFRFYQNVYPITILCLLYFVRTHLSIMAGSRLTFRKLPNVRKYLFPSLVALLFFGFGISQYTAWSRFASEMKFDFDIAGYERSNGAFVQDLFSSLPRLPSVGVIAAGGFKYTYSGEVVDLVGLNNSVVAHNHGRRIGYKSHAAFELESFYKLRPDIVLPFIVNDSWQYNEKGLESSWENQLAFKRLYDQPQFLDSYQYAKICKASQSRCTTYLIGWFRRDFLESLSTRGEFFVERYEYIPSG